MAKYVNLYENNWFNEHHKVVVISSKTMIMLSNPIQNRYPREEMCEMVVIL